jgi:hypothetical protein
MDNHRNFLRAEAAYLTQPDPECDHGESVDYEQDGPEPWIDEDGDCVNCGEQVVICGDTIERDGKEYTCWLPPHPNHLEHKFEYSDEEFSITVEWWKISED